MHGVKARPLVSLLTPVRNRPHHLAKLVAWLDREISSKAVPLLELVIVESGSRDGAEYAKAYPWLRYSYEEAEGAFNKSRLLNVALTRSWGDFVSCHDVDLLPCSGVLKRHLQLARNLPGALVGGYRLFLAPGDEAHVIDQSGLLRLLRARGEPSLAPEDRPSALLKYLTGAERFAACPLFRREWLKSVGGWDEAYVGWGAEDQDLIHRVLRLGLALVRCPDLVYLHMAHGPDPDWNVPALTETNRRRFASVHGGFE